MLSLAAHCRSENLEDMNVDKLLTQLLKLPMIMPKSGISPKVLNKKGWWTTAIRKGTQVYGQRIKGFCMTVE